MMTKNRIRTRKKTPRRPSAKDKSQAGVEPLTKEEMLDRVPDKPRLSTKEVRHVFNDCHVQTIYKMKDSMGLSGAIYTQITDVEVECNGLLTYDRAIVKPDLERVAAVNRGDFSKLPPPPIVKTVVPTSEKKAQQWRYTFTRPGAGWFKPGFDGSGWKTGPGGFGTKTTPGAVVGTVWNTADIWLRREVTIPEGDYTHLGLRIHHDEDAQVYINGVKAADLKQYVVEYQVRPLNEKGRAAIKPGKAVLAVHCRQTNGGQFIDFGLVDVTPSKKR